MKIIIYGYPRTGTTMLAKIVAAHPVVGNLIYEPTTLLNSQSFAKELTKLFDSHDIIKVVASHVHVENLKQLFSYPDKLIVTQRNNLLRCAVSYGLALQTNVWQSVHRTMKYGDNLNSLDVDWLAQQIKGQSNYIDIRDSILKIDKIPHYKLIYEQFFLPSNHIEQLESLYQYLELDISDELKEQLLAIMGGCRLNTPDIYCKIPNSYQIERTLGSNKTGWLYRRG